MTFIRASATFFALIFSVQISMASGPTLLDDETASRTLVPAFQIKAEEALTASSWWGLSSWMASAKHKVKTLFTVPPKKESSWQEQWDAIVEHMQEKTVEYHKGGFWAANGVAKVVLKNPEAESELRNLSIKLSQEGIDLVEDQDLSEKIDHAQNLALLKDVQKLKLGGFAALLYNLTQQKEDFPKFVNLLSQFYQEIADKNKVLKDEPFFKDGDLMARCLWDITKMTRTEEQFPHLKQRVLNFYTDYDGGKLSPYSKGQLDNLRILYLTDSDVGFHRSKSSSSFSIGSAAKATGIVFLAVGLGFLQGVAAQTIPQPPILIDACRGPAIQCLSAFGPAVGFGTQVFYFTQMPSLLYNGTVSDMQKSSLSTTYGDTRGDINTFVIDGIYAEISSWNNGASPNVTRVLNSNGFTYTKGVTYQPGSATQHTETSFDNPPTSSFNIVTTPNVAGSINPYYYELPTAGDRWFLMTQYTDNQTIVVSEVFRPAAGAPLLKSYANMVITPQSAAWKINLSALQSVYVPAGTPARVTSQQGLTADQLQASYSQGPVAANDCVTSITIEQFLAQNNINLSGLLSCMQNAGYNPLSCRTFTNPFGGYVQLMNYYMMNGVELHEVLVSGSTYTHDIYTSTGASTMSRLRHTFDWKAQGAPTTTTTAVAQSLNSRQGSLPTYGAIRKFAVLYYSGNDSAEPANVIKVDENGVVSYGTYFGTNRCATRKRDVAEEQPQTQIKIEKRTDKINVKEFQASETYTDKFWRFFGYGPSIILPRSEMRAEDWYQFQQHGPLVDGRPMRGFMFFDKDQEHDVHFEEDGDTFQVTTYLRNITGSTPHQKKWIPK